MQRYPIYNMHAIIYRRSGSDDALQGYGQLKFSKMCEKCKVGCHIYASLPPLCFYCCAVDNLTNKDEYKMLRPIT